MLVVEHERGSVTRLALERLGVTSQPSSLTYVDEGVVFLGSSFGNSQLVRLLTEPADDGTYLQTLASYENLGPIVDFVVVDLERQGQGQVVTCSGAHKDGSLRVVRNGIGIHEQARVELPGIKGMWSLRNAAAGAAAADGARFLVLSFISETRVLAMQDDDEIGEVELPGFDAECATLHCSDFGNGAVVQVTTRGARLLDASTMALASEWAPADGASISLACADGERLLVATAGRKLVMLTVTGGAWTVAAEATMAHEVACIALAPQTAGGSSAMETDAAAPLPPMAAAGLWTDLTVRLLSVGLEEVGCEALGGEVIPRSLLFASFEGASRHYLLCALGDGKLVSFALDLTGAGGGGAGGAGAVTLGERKVAALGTQPLSSWPSSAREAARLRLVRPAGGGALGERQAAVREREHQGGRTWRRSPPPPFPSASPSPPTTRCSSAPSMPSRSSTCGLCRSASSLGASPTSRPMPSRCSPPS